MAAEAAAPKKRSPLRIVLILAIVIAAGFGIKWYYTRNGFLYAGTLEATKVDLSAQLSSSIKAVNVQEGAHVKAGDELVALTCEDVKVTADLATSNYDRSQRLYKSGTASQEAWDLARNRKQDSDVKLGWCSVRSPIDGSVLSRYREPGEWVTPGTKLLTLADIRNIWAYIYIPQPDVARLKPGMKLKATLPEMSNREFEGTVVKINDEAEFTPKNVQTRAERTRLVFGVKINFQESNADEILKPGMTIEVALPKG